MINDKSLKPVVDKIYDEISKILKSMCDRDITNKHVLKEILRVKEITAAIFEKYDEEDELDVIINFLNVLEYIVQTKERWES